MPDLGIRRELIRAFPCPRPQVRRRQLRPGRTSVRTFEWIRLSIAFRYRLSSGYEPARFLSGSLFSHDSPPWVVAKHSRRIWNRSPASRLDKKIGRLRCSAPEKAHALTPIESGPSPFSVPIEARCSRRNMTPSLAAKRGMRFLPMLLVGHRLQTARQLGLLEHALVLLETAFRTDPEAIIRSDWKALVERDVLLADEALDHIHPALTCRWTFIRHDTPPFLVLKSVGTKNSPLVYSPLTQIFMILSRVRQRPNRHGSGKKSSAIGFQTHCKGLR